MFLFFFKQKTAYEMRISDWSSDVCSSDLDRADATDVQAHRGIELQRVAAAGGFRTLAGHHDADLVPQLVDEEHHAVAALDVAGQLAQRLAHRSEEHTSELQSLMSTSYAVFCLKKKK